MLRINNMSKYILLLLPLFSLACGNALAQDVVFSASASAAKIGIQDQVQVQYSIKDVDNLQSLGPDASIKQDFDVVGGPYSSQGSQVRIINGKMTQSKSVTITYILQPKHKGKLTIPAANAQDANGEVYTSNSIPIEVVEGSLAQQQQQRRSRDPFGDDPFDAIMRQRQRQMQALRQRQQQQRQQQQTQPTEDIDLGKDLFIKVVVDKSNVYVGEQITASYKLYARVPMNVNISKLPSLNGFWTQDFEMPNGKITPQEEIIDGQRYQVFTLKKSALFPQQTGTLELDPAEADGMARIVQKSQGRDPFFDDPFFNSFFMDDPFADEFFGRMSYKDVKVNLKSKPVKITVKPLPKEGQPSTYGGAVGNFQVSSTVDKTEITTDDVVNVVFTIEGSGNIKLIEAPTLDLPNGLTSYDPQIVDTITGRSTTIRGKKIITYTITPQIPGDYTIPPIPFSYFNTSTGTYDFTTTKAITLKVKPGQNYSAKNTDVVKLTDIHNINTTPLDDLILDSKPMVLTVGYWSMYALPLFAFIGIIAWKRREHELSKDTVLLRNKRANKVALKRLTTAKKLLEEKQQTPFYEEISKAIWLYLSDKLNIPLSSLSRENVWDALQEHNISKENQKLVERVMDECETALYAGKAGAQQMQQTYNDAVDAISKLEETFK